MENFYTPEEISKKLNVHLQTVLNYIRDGRINAIKLDKGYRVSGIDFQKFIEQSKVRKTLVDLGISEYNSALKYLKEIFEFSVKVIQESKKEDFIGEPFLTLLFEYMSYQSSIVNDILNSSQIGGMNQISLSILSRPLFEIVVNSLYISKVFPNNKNENAQRYIDFFFVKQFQLGETFKDNQEYKEEYIDLQLHYSTKYQEFINKYSIKNPKNDLKDWSGISLYKKCSLIDSIENSSFTHLYITLYSHLSNIEHANINGMENLFEEINDIININNKKYKEISSIIHAFIILIYIINLSYIEESKIVDKDMMKKILSDFFDKYKHFIEDTEYEEFIIDI